MKQTAVEWLEQELLKPNIVISTIIDKAKAMEKQQIVDSFEKGYENGAGVSDEDPIYHGGNYYNQNFKSE